MIFDIENPENITSADIVIGIPSLNEEDNIDIPTTVACEGLRTFYPNKKACIVNVDNFSTDNTKQVFFATETETPKMYVTSPENQRGKGVNIRNLFEVGVELGAEVILMVDADLKSITPDWIENLSAPLYDGYDYVVPVYLRHKYDGTITNNIAYPMLRTLYGLRVRQPIAGDFGISGRLAKCYLVEKTWSDSVSQFGIDIWMTTIAIGRNFHVCQTFMGSPKIHAPKDPGSDLGPMFSEVVGTIFQLMDDFSYLWKDTDRSRPSIIYGFGLGQEINIPDIAVTKENLYETFTTGYEKFHKLWEAILSEQTWNEVNNFKDQEMDDFSYPTPTWAHILFDFAIAYQNEKYDKDQLIEALIPFYHSRTLSFVNKTLHLNMQEAEDYLEKICRVFEEEKPYLKQRWDKEMIKQNGGGRVKELLQTNS